MVPDRFAAPLLSSGIAPVDAVWGGLASGGTYLVVGPALWRGRLALAALRARMEVDGLGLLSSPRAPEALLAEASTAGFDLAGAVRRKHAKLLHAPAAADLGALGDDALARALGHLADGARQDRPALLAVEDFSAFVRFASFDAFAAAFRALTEVAAALPTVLLLGMGEPANEASRRLLLFLQGETAGTLHATPQPEGDVELTLVPGPLHPVGACAVRWSSSPHLPLTSPSIPFEEMTLNLPPLPVQLNAPETPPAAEGTAQPGLEVFEADSFEAGSFEAGSFGPDLFDPDPVGSPPLETELEATDPFAEEASEDAEDPFGSDGFAGPAGLALDPPDLFVAVPSSDGVPPGDADLTPVTPVEPTEAPLAGPAERDPFSVDLGPDLLALGHFVDSRTSGAPPRFSGDGLSEGGLDGFAASIREAAYPELFTPPPGAAGQRGGDTPASAAPADTPEAAFRRALEAAFARREDAPFLVLALRLDPASPHADLLPAIAFALNVALGRDGALFGDPASGRLVALWPGEGQEASARLFEAVRAHLHATAPDRAAEALRAVGALVVPNGLPFLTADALLLHVFAE